MVRVYYQPPAQPAADGDDDERKERRAAYLDAVRKAVICPEDGLSERERVLAAAMEGLGVAAPDASAALPFCTMTEKELSRRHRDRRLNPLELAVLLHARKARLLPVEAAQVLDSAELPPPPAPKKESPR